MKSMCTEKRENEDDTGILFELYEKISEILSEYNDTVKGRCAVCLEEFLKEEEDDNGVVFTERQDLVRVDLCYHRFHLICVYRDWYMKRKDEKDSYGGTIHYEIPEIKKCPICRREVGNTDADYIKSQYQHHPEVEDGGYSSI
jgi:hypothetical protein